MTTAPRRILTAADPPAAHAQAALDGINADPDGFDMRSWFGSRGNSEYLELAADQAPLSCGSTLCAAGWVAHNAGHTLVRCGGDSFIRGPRGRQLSIGTIAADLLRLDDGQQYDLFHADESSAKYALELIARGVEPDWDDDGETFYEWLYANGYAGPAEDE